MSTFFFCHFASAEDSYIAKPTGKYEVGFKDVRLVNGTLINDSYLCPGKTDLWFVKGQNENDFGQDNQIDFCREIMLRVYYPTNNKHDLPYENYYLPAMNFIEDIIRGAKIPGMTEEEIKTLDQVKTFSIKEPKIVDEKFPVLIFDPGAGYLVQHYEDMIEDIVSHGYIVMATNNTFIGTSIPFPADSTHPDGRVVQGQFTSTDTDISKGDDSVLNDILFMKKLLDKRDNSISTFTNHMKLDHVGVFGHSIGGMALVEAVREYPYLFQAAMSLDGDPFAFRTLNYDPSELAGFPKTPFLRIFAASMRDYLKIPKSDQFQLFDNNYYALLAPNENNDSFPYYTDHSSYTDFSTLKYQPTIEKLFNFYPPGGVIGTADGRHVMQVINDYMVQFFDKYLKPNEHKPSPNLNSCTAVSNDSMLTCKNTQ